MSPRTYTTPFVIFLELIDRFLANPCGCLCNMHRAMSLVPKLLLGALALCIFYQLYWIDSEPVSWQPSNHTEPVWFQDAQKSKPETSQCMKTWG
jgi:hypothetical protein